MRRKILKKKEVGDQNEDVKFADIPSEDLDRENSPPTYEINVFPTDFTLEILNQKLISGELKIPQFQRAFVWKQKQASRLIESFLLGLPVPPVFLYVDEDEKLLVVDGQQRLKTIQYYFSGFFGEPVNGKRTVFSLIGLNEKSRFKEKTYQDLKKTDETAARKLDNSVLRSVIIKQLNPTDDTSIYHIFERLNTGGTPLTGQEIRNCIYHGPFNDLLRELNRLPEWRSIFGKENDDTRQRDIELILRFFALRYNAENYEKPMKDFLSKFMSRNRQAASGEDGYSNRLKEFRDLFIKAAKNVQSSLGGKPFRLGSGLNAALFDSVFTAFSTQNKIKSEVSRKYKTLLRDKKFLHLVTASTTDKESVSERLAMARKKLFGAA